MIRVPKKAALANNLVRPKPCPEPCPQLPGTILRIFIPAGAVINLLNLIELNSPSGICLIIRIPILGGAGKKRFNVADIVNAVQHCGGTVEVLQE